MIREEDFENLLNQRDKLAYALFSFMDGMPDHHIQDETGLSDEDCDLIAEARKMALEIAVSRGWIE